MADNLAEMFTEASAEADAEVDVVEVDNLDTEADEVEDETVEDIEVDDDSDTDEEEPDDLDDDESPEDVVVEDDGFNWDEIEEKYGDRPVKLIVNGQEVEKPLRELRNMAMMREDYSRKTAEVAQAAKAAQWAQQVQASFEDDPFGTLQAFAEAYGIDFGGSPEPDVDPYEDLDPDVAVILRKMDEQEARHQQELQAVRAQTEAITEKELVAEIKSEVAELKNQFGPDLDELEMMRVAAYYNVPLKDAAFRVMGEKYWSMSEAEKAAAAKAEAAASERTGRKTGSAKKRASSTSKRGYDGSGATSVSKDDFANIGELFEIELNSTS